MSTNPSTAEQLQIKALLSGPASPPPAGTLPNFQRPAGLENVLWVTIALSFALPSLALLLRIYTRRFVLRSMGYDDYASVLAWLSLTSYLVITCLIMKARVGVHMWDMRLKDFFGLLHLLLFASILYGPTAFFAKASILFQYSRIFNPHGKGDLPLFLAIRITVIIIFIFYFMGIFLNIFQCTPIEKSWNKLITTGHCFDYWATYKAVGIFNVVSDFAILIMPIPCVWNLHMPLRRKLLTLSVFAFGFLACLTSILRTYSTWRFVESADKSYWFGRLGLWSTAELAVGIVTGCLPVTPKFVQHVRPKLHSALSTLLSTPTSDAIKTLTSTTLAKIKAPFGSKYGIEPGTASGADPTPPYASQPHGEYYMLDELATSQHQIDNRAAIPTPSGGGAATRRDDLEYGY